MSGPPSPTSHQVASSGTQRRKKDRHLTLDIPESDKQTTSDGEIRYERAHDTEDVQPHNMQQPSFHVSLAEDSLIEREQMISRSVSATSSLDPYYFGIQSPSDSPLPSLPNGSNHFSTTLDHRLVNEPTTPARDPAVIDRRGLVGVGELTTPRWTRAERINQEDSTEHEDGFEVVAPEDIGDDDEPDSPWTIEAVDGESSEREEPSDFKSIPRPLRGRPSMTEESGGEEILYPRKPGGVTLDFPKRSKESTYCDNLSLTSTLQLDTLSASESVAPTSPPSAFSQPHRKARKRTSDEFELDQSGTLVSKRASSSSTGASKDKSKDDKLSARKHRSLNVNSISSRENKGKERRRESIGLTVSSNTKPIPIAAKSPEKHSRQPSSSGPPITHPDPLHPRRVHTTDFSHLPPSPSSSSIQQFLKHTTSTSSHTPPLSSKESQQSHPSPNVAHSLLRGTQEGWSVLDDEATAEALRKLDGLTGKTARARASVGSFVRPASGSRPGTPPGKSGAQWEGINPVEGVKSYRRSSGNAKESPNVKEKDAPQHQFIGFGLASADLPLDGNELLSAISSDEQPASSLLPEKTPKKVGTASARLSFTPKRGSTSSTTYTSTPTTSSRDSASMSAGTSVTSVSAASGRPSSGKAKRNSAGSDISSQSNDATSLKDRVASLAVNGDVPDEGVVPPVPPLPKDLSTYRSPPPTSAGLTFPSMPNNEEKERRSSYESDQDRTLSLEVPPSTSSPSKPSSPLVQSHRQSQLYASAHTTVSSVPESSSIVPKTPSKKWSISNALNLKLSSSPSSSSGGSKSGFPLSPRAVSFGHQLRKSTSIEQAMSPASSSASKGLWSPRHPDAMASAASLASLSSVGSVRTHAVPSAAAPSKTPDRTTVPSRSGTSSSASTSHATSALAAPQYVPLSPTSSVRRGQSSKRLTPSSIPFFRRSSSQSMQFPPLSAPTTSSSPTLSTSNISSTHARFKTNHSPPRDYNPPSTSVPGSAQKKSSVLSLGLPSLLRGSSSRRSLHADSKDAAKLEIQRARDAARDAEKDKGRLEKLEKEKQKKEDKDRSESRISVLMGRKRGKTLSSAEPKKAKSPVHLPPIQMSALEPTTAQRVARLKSSSSTSTASTPTATRTTSSSSRLTSQTVSSMQKQSDTSLRSRNQLPTIAGSPSVGTNGSQTLKEVREPPPSSLMNSISSNLKETPTKIPRIASRTSAGASPPLKNSVSNRRTSVNVNGPHNSTNPSPTELATNEFGVMENGDTTKATFGPSRHPSVRGSPSMNSTSRVPRQASASTSTVPRKGIRDSVSFTGIRKSSTGSVASVSSTVPTESHHRFSALSPSKGLKLLTPKISLPAARVSNSVTQNIHQTVGSPSSSRQSLSTPSPAPSSVDEEELLGDEEMLQYIRRQQAKKMATGASQEELDELLRFPEPLPPGTPSTPTAIMRSSQQQYLSEFERKEILDYPSVYCIGANSKKKLAVPDVTTNNHGYDDERGDYLVVNHDHLAYRYEIIDTLGKGSFGQVLHCRDHCTGESMAIKIIRNKKRFHHQALVEIKILDNLRKWDSEEKHHVIKMTEHFYFRNHLCIAMELLSINLYELIKANGFVGFTTALIRRFTSQMLLSLSLMRHHRIVHCDLKPENVLLRHPAKSAIKVIDFGSSCFEHEKIYTYIQSRFYRSPEVILGMNYHMAIDMWSLGCILAELYTGFPIFPGENEQEQLSCIMEVLGIPDKEFVNRSSRKKLFFDPGGAPRAVINSKGRRRRPGTKTLAQVLRCNDEDFVDFISKCLVWDPERRIKPQAAMRHPFVTGGRRPKPASSTSKSTLSSSSLAGNRTKQLTETPKKSQISAPTPLTARSSRTTGNGAPLTPSNSSHALTLGSSRSYRAPQTQSLSTYHSSRALSGFAATAAK